jgi:hypothetical protein
MVSMFLQLAFCAQAVHALRLSMNARPKTMVSDVELISIFDDAVDKVVLR